MKFGYIFSICGLLLMNFYVSDSVLCPVQIDDGFILSKKNCTSCVMYQCPTLISGFGCPEDFFRRCSNQKNVYYEKNKANIDIVRSKNFNDLEYRNDEVIYNSGCQNESDGTDCIGTKDEKFDAIHGLNLFDYVCIEAGKPCSKSDDGTNSSNNQYDALKMIGIFAIGWVLSVA